MNVINDRGVEFNSSITEYDIRHAQINVMKYYHLFNDEALLNIYDALPKDEREVKCGLLLKKYPDLIKSLEKGFNDIVKEFLQANCLDIDDDVISIKRDAVFVINKPVKVTKFGPVEFVNKNKYHAYVNIGRLEFYVGNTTVDVKGLGDKWIYHENGIIAIIKDFINMLESTSDPYEISKYLKDLCKMYKTKQLGIDVYKEFNSTSMYKCIIDGEPMYMENIGYDILDECCDISYNYINIILPILRLFL